MILQGKLYLAAALLFSLTTSPAYSQCVDPESIPIITVHYAESHFIQEVYDYIYPRYVLGNYSPQVQPTWGFDGHLYRVDIMIILEGENFMWNKPLQVQFTFENGDTQTKVINEDMFPLYPGKFYNFSFDVKTRVKGLTRINLFPASGMNEEGIRFYGTSVSLR